MSSLLNGVNSINHFEFLFWEISHHNSTSIWAKLELFKIFDNEALDFVQSEFIYSNLEIFSQANVLLKADNCSWVFSVCKEVVSNFK